MLGDSGSATGNADRGQLYLGEEHSREREQHYDIMIYNNKCVFSPIPISGAELLKPLGFPKEYEHFFLIDKKPLCTRPVFGLMR